MIPYVYRECTASETLPEAKKKSFVLPFDGGEIWFEHLDGMYQYTDLVLAKLKNESQIFLLPSKPAHICFVLYETVVTETVVDEISSLLFNGRKRFMRVCFIDTDWKIEKMFRTTLCNRSSFVFAFINDFEKVKEWLISESI